MGFWSLDQWKQGRETSSVVTNFTDHNFKDGCYRLALGAEAIVSAEATETKDIRRNVDAEGSLRLLPGQFAYLITKERVTIPETAIGLINIAYKTKLKGIVNISGFHADPGYDGKLIFTIFNAGAMAVHIGAGERMFRLWLLDYDGEVATKNPGYDTIPHEFADGLVGAYPSPFVVQQKMKELDERIDGRFNKISEHIQMLQREVDEKRVKSWQVVVALFVLAALLFPFVASLYAGLFGSTLQEPVSRIFLNGADWLQKIF